MMQIHTLHMQHHLICVECVSERMVKVSLGFVVSVYRPFILKAPLKKKKKRHDKNFFLAATVEHVQSVQHADQLIFPPTQRIPTPVSLWQSVTVTDRRMNNTGCLSWHVMKALVGFVCIQVESRFSPPPARRLDRLRTFNSLKIHKCLWWSRSRWTLKDASENVVNRERRMFSTCRAHAKKIVALRC